MGLDHRHCAAVSGRWFGWLADHGKHVHIWRIGAAAVCAAAVGVPSGVDGVVSADGYCERADLEGRCAARGEKAGADLVWLAACRQFCVAAAVFQCRAVRNCAHVADIVAGIGDGNDYSISAHQPYRGMVDGTISDMAAVCNLSECGDLAAESERL